MILQCSECKARYLVPDQAIGAKGRQVRCAKCGHSWFEAPPPAAKDPALEDLDKLLDEINARPKPIPKGSNLPKIPFEPASIIQKGFTGFMLIAAIGLVLLIAAPGLLGLPSSKGLVLADVGIIRVARDQQTSYQINGKIANMSSVAKTVPTLRVTLVDTEGKSLQYWDFGGDATTIDPGKSIPFATGDLELRFSKGSRFVVEVGNPLELALRRKPE